MGAPSADHAALLEQIAALTESLRQTRSAVDLYRFQRDTARDELKNEQALLHREIAANRQQRATIEGQRLEIARLRGELAHADRDHVELLQSWQDQRGDLCRRIEVLREQVKALGGTP